MMQLLVCPKDTLRKVLMHLYMSCNKCRQTSRYDRSLGGQLLSTLGISYQMVPSSIEQYIWNKLQTDAQYHNHDAQAIGLQRLQVSALDAVVEERATVLETVSERLSTHVLANYDTFVRGVNEAASVETDLQVGPIIRSMKCPCKPQLS